MTGKSSRVFAILLLVVWFTAYGSNPRTCNDADGVGSWMGDGDCDPQNLISECEWDGGDCCKGTCVDEEFLCNTNDFLCTDPEALDTCEEITLSPCTAQVKSHWLVETTTQAQALAEAVHCSGGTFDVEWRGSIIMNTEIVVVGGTALNITGSVGSSAVLDGGGRSRLFNVVNASLQLNDVEVRNGCATFGGAIVAISSTLTLRRTIFASNTAKNKNGGAVFAYSGSNVSFVEGTTFLNNSSKSHGGAIYLVKNSTAYWEHVSTFSGNRASNSGGALFVAEGSTAFWAAESFFNANSALAYRGGALYLETNSIASWSATAHFADNSAEYEGGAVCVDVESVASWNGGANFSGNTAISGAGGAMLIADSSTVVWRRATTFKDNISGTQGGAVSSKALQTNKKRSYLSMRGTVAFLNNKCGSNGGGLTVLGGISVSVDTDDLIFSGNEAVVAGGGAFISASGMDSDFINTSFLSNSAEIGGGVFITGSEISLEFESEHVTNTLKFDGCKFIGNEARTTGGAIEITTGSVNVSNSLFKRNVAGSGGGALRLRSVTSLYGCTFDENLSDVDGSPAIMNTGYALDMEKCNFHHNAYDCDAGTFLDESTAGDRFASVCFGCGVCDTCTVEGSNRIPACLEAIEHSSSRGGNLVTLETLSIEAGYWRATNHSTAVLPCYIMDACAGGMTGSPDYCNEGYTGPYCAVCTEGYVKGPGFVCKKCSDNVWGARAAVGAAVVTVVVTFIAIRYIVSTERGGARRVIMSRTLRRVPLHSVKIIIVAWQILTQFATVAEVTYPGIYQRFLNIVDIINLDPTWMLSAGCLADVDFHGRFLVMTIGPILTMLVLSGTYSYVSRKHAASEHTLQIAQHKHVSAVLFIMFIVYTSASSVVFQMFDCDALDDGNSYLRTDYTVKCSGPRHRVLTVLAGFMMLVYPFGIPAFFAFLLFKNRTLLLDKADRADDLSVRSISDLWEPYKPSRFYYEVIECSRRIMLMGVTMVLDDDSGAQIAVTLMIAIIFTVISEGLAPYESKFDAWVSRLGHAVVVFSIYFALLLKVNISKDSQASQRVFEVLLVVTHLLLVFATFIEATLASYSLRKEQEESPWPRHHGYPWQRFRISSLSMTQTSPSMDNGLGICSIELRTLSPSRSVRNLTSACDPTVAHIVSESGFQRQESI